MKRAVLKAIELSGGQLELAEKVGVSQQSVSLWLKNGYVPVRRAYYIEKILNQKITHEELIKPDDMN